MIPVIEDCKPYQGFGYYQSTGVGAESKTLERVLAEQYREATRLPVVLSGKHETLAALRKFYADCSKENWDGEGAAAVPLEAYIDAFNFISLLPIIGTMPEIVPLPNGQIGLEWFKAKNYMLVIALSGNNRITYANLAGSETAESKVVKFDDGIPSKIIEFLSQLKVGELI